MSRPSLAPSAVLLIALAAPMARGQQLDGGGEPDRAPAVIDPMSASRGARHLLRNGNDYLSYRQYERALAFFREAETRQKELTEAERLALRKGIQKARQGMREPDNTPEPAALAGRARPATAAPTFALARPTPEPSPAAAPSAASPDAIQLASADVVEAPKAAAVARREEPVPTVAAEPLDPSTSPSTPPPLSDPAPEAMPEPPPLGDPAGPAAAELPALPSLPEPAVAPTPAPVPEPTTSTAPAMKRLMSSRAKPQAPASAPEPKAEPPAPLPMPEPTATAPAPAPTVLAPEPKIEAPEPRAIAPEPTAPVTTPEPRMAAAPEPGPSTLAPEPLDLPPLPEPAEVILESQAPAPAAEAPAPAAEAPAPAPTAGRELPPLPPEGPARRTTTVSRPTAPAADARASSISESDRRAVEELARRLEPEIEARRRQRDVDARRIAQAGPRGGGGGGDRGTTNDNEPQANRLELPRAPSPTEARPIRPIPVPDEFIPMSPRQWSGSRKAWAAAATCHGPLYFQDAVLERYGQSAEQALGPAGRFASFPLDDPKQSNQRQQLLQPMISFGLFCGQIVALPYNLIVDPPWEPEYDLGYARPGDRIPPDTYYLPYLGVGPPLRGKKY